MSLVGAMGLVLTILGFMGWSAFGFPAHYVGLVMLGITIAWYVYDYRNQ